MTGNEMALMASIAVDMQDKEVNDVLDKIRAEIADLDDADYDYEGYYKAVTDAVKIIDKYRESEPQERSEE